MKIKVSFLSILMCFSLSYSCHSQTEKQQDKTTNREPVVAGQFYPDDEKSLRSQLNTFFSKAKERRSEGDLQAVIAPHAGYVFSGRVAASAYNQISPDAEYDNIFIIAPSHRARIPGASIYNIGNYETPLGEVKVNRTLADKLIEGHDFFSFEKQAHKQEHSL
ncbi:MAG: AmmeMemoRadiSam system protein B, partial [Bacteroidales bacterium]